MIHSLFQVLLANNNNNNNNTSSNSSSSAANLNSRRVKKNNVIVSDEEAEADEAQSKATADLLQLNGHHDDAEFDFTVSEESQQQLPASITNQPVAKQFSILSNPINYKKQQQQADESTSKSGHDSSNSDEAAPGSPESVTSEKTSAAVGGASDFETCNLIPITSSSFSVNINPNLADNLSSMFFFFFKKKYSIFIIFNIFIFKVNSYQSENSNDINFGMGAQAHR